MFFAHGQIAAWQHAQVEMQSNDWHAAVWMLITINTGERVFGVRVRQELLGSDTRAQSEEGSSKDVEAGPSDEGKGKEECKKDDEEQEDEDSERKDRDRHRHSELIKLGAAGISLPPPLTVSLFASVLYS